MRPLQILTATVGLASCNPEFTQPINSPVQQGQTEEALPPMVWPPFPEASRNPEKEKQEALARELEAEAGIVLDALDRFNATQLGVEQHVEVGSRTVTVKRSQDFSSDNEQRWPKDQLEVSFSSSGTIFEVQLNSAYRNGTGEGDKTEDISLTEWATADEKRYLLASPMVVRMVENSLDGVTCTPADPCLYGDIAEVSSGQREIITKAAHLFEEMNKNQL